MAFDLLQAFSAFTVLFAVIDIFGSLPIFMSIEQKGGKINAFKATLVSAAILLLFMFLGEAMLGIFGVNVNSFAVAGSFVLFALGFEMVLGVEIFKQDSPTGASIVPVAFPLIAGPGSFTAILSLRAEFDTINIVVALLLNMIVVFAVLRSTRLIERLLGQGGIYILKKFFGIILLAISVKLFTSNLTILIDSFR
jgi:multiple antibiotic resistance protein